MATGQLAAVLRHIRKLAADHKAREQTDGVLLRAFLRGNDQAAFEALLRRHGPMVLRVCRRTLRNVHDAEDALQATFLVLAQRAASIRKKESLASWLHGVAHRMATHSKRAAARRHRHELHTNPTPPHDPALSAAWQEIQVLLDEEIARLPETLRAPFVLCCVDNKTCAEAACHLGLQEGTIWNRLGRARKLLQERLTRRGVTLSAGFLAALLAQNAASALVPAALVVSTAQAATQIAAGKAVAAGLLSAGATTLLQGVTNAMFMTKCKIATGLLFAISFAAGAGLLTHQVLAGRNTDAARPPTSQTAPQENVKAEPAKQPARPRSDAVKPETDQITVRGRVLDPDGNPVAGAKVYLHDAKIGDTDYTARAASGADGRFELTIAKSELDQPASGYTAGGYATSDHQTSQVMAVAKGYGCAWATVGQVEAERELSLRLVKDIPISGRVIDGEGRPVAGAKVKVAGVGTYPGEDLTKMIEHFRLRGWPGGSEIRWEGGLPEQAKVLTTAADGRFRLAGFGRERSVRLIVEGPAIEYTSILVMTRAGDAVLAPKPPQAVRQSKVYGATFDYLAAPSRPIRGVVRDKGTGKPVAGVSLWSYHTTHRPRTDNEGRYEMLGCPKTATYVLYLEPPDGLHFRIRARVSDTLGLEPLTADIALPSGITVHGRVLDKASGKQVPGVRISYYVVFPNPKVGRLDDYHEYEGLSIATSGPDGSYALAVFPAPESSPPPPNRCPVTGPRSLLPRSWKNSSRTGRRTSLSTRTSLWSTVAAPSPTRGTG